MSKARATFRQSDATRAAKAAMAAGLDVTRFEIEPSGKIVIVTVARGEIISAKGGHMLPEGFVP